MSDLEHLPGSPVFEAHKAKMQGVKKWRCDAYPYPSTSNRGAKKCQREPVVVLDEVHPLNERMHGPEALCGLHSGRRLKKGGSFNPNKYCSDCGHFQIDTEGYSHARDSSSGMCSAPGCDHGRRTRSSEHWSSKCHDCGHDRQRHLGSEANYCSDCDTTGSRRTCAGSSGSFGNHARTSRPNMDESPRKARMRPALERLASGLHGSTPGEAAAARAALDRLKSLNVVFTLSKGEGVRAWPLQCTVCGDIVRVTNFMKRKFQSGAGWRTSNVHLLAHEKAGEIPEGTSNERTHMRSDWTKKSESPWRSREPGPWDCVHTGGTGPCEHRALSRFGQSTENEQCSTCGHQNAPDHIHIESGKMCPPCSTCGPCACDPKTGIFNHGPDGCEGAVPDRLPSDIRDIKVDKSLIAHPDALEKAAVGPDEHLLGVAQDYSRKPINTDKVKQDPAVAKRIAAAYERAPMKGGYGARRAYRAFSSEVNSQWTHLQNHGYKMEPWTKPGQPYANSSEMHHDVRTNKHLHYFTGGEKHAFLSTETNNRFRAVHDVFGHAMGGHSFGPNGEESAWKEHSQMFTPTARAAMTSETRGQNSWVTAGPHAEHNRKNPSQTVYAPQKGALLPRNFAKSATWLKLSVAPFEGRPVKIRKTRRGIQFVKSVSMAGGHEVPTVGKRTYTRAEKSKISKLGHDPMHAAQMLHDYHSSSFSQKQRGHLWYPHANHIINTYAGQHTLPTGRTVGYSHHQIAGAFAALSPQKDWATNWGAGDSLIRHHMNGGKLEDWKQGWVTDANKNKAWAALSKKGSPGGPKVSAFHSTMQHINAEPHTDHSACDRAVVDSVMDRAMHGSQQQSKTHISSLGRAKGYGHHENAVRVAAMHAGVEPWALQGTVWGHQQDKEATPGPGYRVRRGHAKLNTTASTGMPDFMRIGRVTHKDRPVFKALVFEMNLKKGDGPKTFPSQDHFYAGRHAAGHTWEPEGDFGVRWKGPDGKNDQRVSVMHDTGDVYAVRSPDGKGPVQHLGRLTAHAPHPEGSAAWKGDINRDHGHDCHYRAFDKLMPDWSSRMSMGTKWVHDRIATGKSDLRDCHCGHKMTDHDDHPQWDSPDQTASTTWGEHCNKCPEGTRDHEPHPDKVVSSSNVPDHLPFAKSEDEHGWWHDNPVVKRPGEGAQRWMEQNPKTATAGYKHAQVDVDRFAALPGENGEHHNIDRSRVNKIADIISSHPDGMKKVGMPLVIVKKDGRASIFEGNHRSRAYQKLGMKKVPIEIRYEGGSEMLPHSFKP